MKRRKRSPSSKSCDTRTNRNIISNIIAAGGFRGFTEDHVLALCRTYHRVLNPATTNYSELVEATNRIVQGLGAKTLESILPKWTLEKETS